MKSFSMTKAAIKQNVIFLPLYQNCFKKKKSQQQNKKPYPITFTISTYLIELL